MIQGGAPGAGQACRRKHLKGGCCAAQMGAEYSDVKNTQVRRITAERLLQSKTTIPHYYLTVDLNADKLLELRSQLNEKLAASGGKLSVNDFIVKASALVRRRCQPADLEMPPPPAHPGRPLQLLGSQCSACRRLYICSRRADAAGYGQSWQAAAFVP